MLGLCAGHSELEIDTYMYKMMNMKINNIIVQLIYENKVFRS